MKYQDLDYAVKLCINLINQSPQDFRELFFAKTDLTAAFRLIPGRREQYPWLAMKMNHPITNQVKYFVDINLPFGASASCCIFQSFSDSLRHLLEALTGNHFQTVLYLDEFLFISMTRQECNRLVSEFIELCNWINCPISQEKTEWATNRIVFLGILLDGISMRLVIPEENESRPWQ